MSEPNTLTQGGGPGGTPGAPGTPAPAATPEPGATPTAAPEPTTPDPWSIPTGWQEEPDLAPFAKQVGKFADPETGNLDVRKLATGYANLEKFKGGPAPAELTPEEYMKGIAAPESLPDGMVYPDEMREALAGLAREAGVSAEGFMKLQEGFLAETAKINEAAHAAWMQQGAADYAELEKEVGAHQMPTYLEAAKRTAQRLGFDLDVDERSPERVKEIRAFAHLGKQISEAALPDPQGGTNPAGGAGGLQEAEDISSNPNNKWYEAYHNPQHPQHADAHAAHDAALTEGIRMAGKTSVEQFARGYGGGRI